MAHYLRAAGYRTILARQDAFRRAGPAARFRRAADHRHLSGRLPVGARLVEGPEATGPPASAWGTCVDAGPCVRNMQIDYDEEVAHVAVQKVYDLARRKTVRSS